MSNEKVLMVLAVGVVASCALWPLLVLYFDTVQAAGRFQLGVFLKGKRSLTRTERRFYGQLKQALPGFDVHAQVAMGALLDVDLARDDPRYWPLRNLFARKIIDFVVFSPRGGVVAVVELDDHTHDRKKPADSERDGWLRQAGIPTVRFDCRDNVRIPDIRRVLGAYTAPHRPAAESFQPS